ncbi:2-succinylbenzoate--CoA ligase [Phormidium sp. CLA17]|nr:2-succinylbenzoate--CoA ligase [Leptolyngbya sp. Cla-17]
MKGAWEYLQERAREDWLIGQDSRAFFELTSRVIAQLQEEKTRVRDRPVIFLAESDPIHFLAKFIAACATGCHLFLCNPTWTDSEWAQVFALAQPTLLYEKSTLLRPPLHSVLPALHSPLPLICIPTGGSSGSIRFAMHTWDTLMASVAGFQHYFGVERIHSCCVLPIYHVSGLMQCLRSLTSGGTLALLPYKTLETSHLLTFDPADFFLSLVPTQLHRLLGSPTLLTQFKTILLGGAPAGSELLEQARQLAIPLAPTYGMTETASQVSTLKPTDFLQGITGCGQVLPHAQITICSATTGEVLGVNQTGVVTIAAKSLMLGYYPEFVDTPRDVACFSKGTVACTFSTDDIGWLDERGYLHILGRQSDKIITGGENVFPAEVEAAILATGLVQDVGVFGVSDPYWGEAIAAIYVPTAHLTVTTLKAALADRLSKFKLPKHWIAVEQLPRNAQGKLNRQELRQLVPTDSTM